MHALSALDWLYSQNTTGLNVADYNFHKMNFYWALNLHPMSVFTASQ